MSIHKNMGSSSSSSSSSSLIAHVVHNLLNITITVILLFFVYCNKDILMAAAARDISDEIQAIAPDIDHVEDDDHEPYNHSFDQNYYVEWAPDHVFQQHQGNVVQLNFDQYGGAAFGSINRYGSGYFHLRMRVPGRQSTGACTTFYLTSHGDSIPDMHDEIDFEFLGPENGQPISLQTNVISGGIMGREETVNLWFDPSADFHTYKILWNQHQTVFYVDNTPIRVYRNRSDNGAAYPTKPMQIEASIWNCTSWAYGGHLRMHWRFFPLKALYRGFNINDGCVSFPNAPPETCYSDEFWWNREDRRTLSDREQRLLEDVRNRYRIYNYCTDTARYPIPLPECLP